MVTIKEIAQKSGVSIGTVDRVLHNRGLVKEETRNRILAVVQELNYVPNTAAQGLAIRKKKLKIAFVIPDENSYPFYKDVREAVERKAGELKPFGVQVGIFRFRIKSGNAIWMEEGMQEYLLEADGIAAMGTQMELSRRDSDIFRRIQEQKKPVVYYNTWGETSGALALVGCNYVESGRLAAGLAALIGGKKAKICVFSEGLETVGSVGERMKGIDLEIKERYPEMKILDCREISDDQIDNYLSAKNMLEKYPDVNIVYIANPGDYRICDAIYRADEEHRVQIITNDMTERQMEMMDKGIIAATVCQEPEKQGEIPLDLLFKYLAFGALPEKKIFYTDLSIHIAQNRKKR